MEGLDEYFFSCPYCGSPVSMIIEMNYGVQEYTEDCEVCCRPIEISYRSEEGQICDFMTTRLDD